MSAEYPVVRCAVESESGVQQESENGMTRCPINHTSSATCIKSNDGTSHQQYKKRHVDGTDKALSSSLSSGIDQGKNQSQCRSKGNARCVARKDVKGDASVRRHGRRQPKYQLASPPRYPQVGKTVEGDEVKKAELIAGLVSPIPTGRKDCGGRRK